MFSFQLGSLKIVCEGWGLALLVALIMTVTTFGLAYYEYLIERGRLASELEAEKRRGDGQ